MRWKERAVLIPVQEGFIGSHLTERLVKLGANVKAFVRYNSRNYWGLIDFFREILAHRERLKCNNRITIENQYQRCTRKGKLVNNINDVNNTNDFL